MSRFGKPRNVGSRALYLIVLMLGGLTFLIMLLLVVIVIYSAPDDNRAEFPVHPDAEPGKGCGRIGNITIKYNTADLFFPATYDNVNYWGGEVYLNRTKWCDDALRGINFPVDWPSMKPSEFGHRYYDDIKEDTNSIVITIDHNYSEDAEESMRAILTNRVSVYPEVQIYENIKSVAQYIDSTELYSMRLESVYPNFKETLYWGENSIDDIVVQIRCLENSYLNKSSCSQMIPDSDRGIWVEIRYRIELLDQWKEMHASALTFVDSLTINHEDTP